MCPTTLSRSTGSGSEVRIGAHVRSDNRECTPPLVRLKALCGPGDDGESRIALRAGQQRNGLARLAHLPCPPGPRAPGL